MAGLIVFALMGLGLLAATSMFLFFFGTSVMPLTSDFSTFYASSTTLTLLTLAALAIYGYRRCSLASHSSAAGSLRIEIGSM